MIDAGTADYRFKIARLRPGDVPHPPACDSAERLTIDGAQTLYIESTSHVEHGHLESLSRKLRDELLN